MLGKDALQDEPSLRNNGERWAAAAFPRAESLGTKSDCEGKVNWGIRKKRKGGMNSRLYEKNFSEKFTTSEKIAGASSPGPATPPVGQGALQGEPSG